MSELDDEIASLARASEQHGCSDLWFPFVGRVASAPRALYYRADFKGHKRWCVGGATGDIETFDGNARVSIRLRFEEPDYAQKRGDIKVDPTSDGVDQSGSLFGLIGTNSDFAKLLNSGVGFAIFPSIVTLTAIGNIQPRLTFSDVSLVGQDQLLGLHRGVRGVIELARLVEDISLIKKENYLEEARSEFDCDASSCLLHVSHVGYVRVGGLEGLYYDRKQTLDLIRSLGKDTVTREIESGDSFWTIAQGAYGVGQLGYFLANFNGRPISGRTIRVGETIKVPPLYVFVKQGDHIVKSGDSLWSVWKRTGQGRTWPEFLAIARDVLVDQDKIYPLQVVPPYQ
jgi:hypothetical protein